jgi:hypothetical protein
MPSSSPTGWGERAENGIEHEHIKQDVAGARAHPLPCLEVGIVAPMAWAATLSHGTWKAPLLRWVRPGARTKDYKNLWCSPIDSLREKK